MAELCGEIRELLRVGLFEVWVAGEVHRLRPSRKGHVYFELVEKGRGDQITAKLEAVIWRDDHAAIERRLGEGQRLAEGQEVRCRCQADFYPPFGRLQIVVRDVDPAFGEGRLEARRRRNLEALRAAGLLDRNAGLELAAVPLRLALVTAAGSAAYHDFVGGLEESGYGFEVVFIDAAVQGREAEASLTSALRLAGALAVDAVVLTRGGGSRTDLAAFDSRRVAEAVATCPLPVLTGLGHEIDLSIADRVAHKALRTPTKVAEFLVARVATADQEVFELRRALATRAAERLRHGRLALERAARGVVGVRHRMASTAGGLRRLARALAAASARLPARRQGRLEELAMRLAAAGPRSLVRSGRQPREAGRSLVRAARGRLGALAARLDGLDRLRVQLGPERVLARGFSVTRDAGGRLVRRAADIGYGERITTRLAEGVLTSRVEEA